ncbi:IS5 family transposase [Streptomyces sp. HP-A2021]|uniref:IS5 family transposase n=1 Tax=Streptomyces sp. HP-A2021 TaxID=2927875 RepID=UPI001FAF1861|nr:IS5 family transposase [Streptomyces sp. HP-A2021]UOB15897.1 IS5 family transposase [Streptomyces sp. HP-A2021]
MSRGDLTDAEWAMLEPLLPSTNNRCGRWRDHRQVINGILHRLSTGAQWRELPERFGPWKTVHKRHLLWSADGTWEMLLQHVQAQADAVGDIDWDINVDSTSVRAHHHAAGAPKAEPPAPPDSSGKRAPRRPVRGADAGESAAPPGGGGAAAEALGRSRGGLTCKIHLSAEGHCRPLSLLITPGQRADCTQFEPVMDKIRVPRLGLGRPRRTPNSVAADKAYSNRKTRTYLRKRGIRHVIPEKNDHKAARLRRGSGGGRPPGFDKDRYKKRNTVERAINKLKLFRAVATRYDKRGYVYLGTVTAAALLTWLRS